MSTSFTALSNVPDTYTGSAALVIVRPFAWRTENALTSDCTVFCSVESPSRQSEGIKWNDMAITNTGTSAQIVQDLVKIIKMDGVYWIAACSQEDTPEHVKVAIAVSDWLQTKSREDTKCFESIERGSLCTKVVVEPLLIPQHSASNLSKVLI